MSEALTEQGYFISPNGVRSVWLRYDLETKQKRISALKVKADRGEVTLSDKQIEALNLQLDSIKTSTGQLDTNGPGDLLVQDCIRFDYFSDLGDVFLHLVIDSYSRFVFCLFSESNDSITATALLKEQVIPALSNYNIDVNRILTDRGAEFFSSSEPTPFQYYLDENNVKHLKIKAYNSSKISGLCFEYMQHIKAHFCTTTARQQRISSIKELSSAFDEWLQQDNYHREDTSAYCFGKTHYQTLIG